MGSIEQEVDCSGADLWLRGSAVRLPCRNWWETQCNNPEAAGNQARWAVISWDSACVLAMGHLGKSMVVRWLPERQD